MGDEENTSRRGEKGLDYFRAPDSHFSGSDGENSEIAPWGAWWSLAWALIVICVWGVAQVALMFVMESFVDVPRDSDGKPTMDFSEILMSDGDLIGIMAFGSALVGCVMILAVVQIRGAGFSRGLGLRLPKIWVWPIVLFATPVLLVILSSVVTPFAQENSVADQGKIALAVRETQWLPLLLLGVAIGAPFFEEFLFRGLLHEGLKQSFLGKWGAGILTAIAFSAMHSQYSDPSAFILLFLLGCAFTIGRELSGSIYVPILMHGIQNSIATIPLWLAINGYIPADQIPPEMREVLDYSEQVGGGAEPTTHLIAPNNLPPGIAFPLGSGMSLPR